MTNISDRPPPQSFYNSESQAIEVVNGIEAAKTERRRARTTVTRGPPETEPEAGDSPDLNYLGLTKDDIESFNEAVERRGGRTAYSDWRIIGGIFWKASEAALKASGQKSRRSRKYQEIFHSSIISKLLPQIAENAGTAEQYRLALLAIEEADAKDGKREFSKWYEEHQPRAVNPVALRTAFRAFRDRDKRPKAPKQRNGTKQQQKLARAQEKYADQIAEFESAEPSSAMPTAENLLQRTWILQMTMSQEPSSAFDTLLTGLASLAAQYGVKFDPKHHQNILEVAFKEAETDTDAA
jgi:hypothetical protein